MLTLDPRIEEALTTIQSFIEGVYNFTIILFPKGREAMDEYCTGMIFGLEGSKMLVKVANTLINPIGEDGQPKKFDKNNVLPIGTEVAAKGKDLMKGIFNTVKLNVPNIFGGDSDEL